MVFIWTPPSVSSACTTHRCNRLTQYGKAVLLSKNSTCWFLYLNILVSYDRYVMTWRCSLSLPPLPPLLRSFQLRETEFFSTCILRQLTTLIFNSFGFPLYRVVKYYGPRRCRMAENIIVHHWYFKERQCERGGRKREYVRTITIHILDEMKNVNVILCFISAVCCSSLILVFLTVTDTRLVNTRFFVLAYMFQLRRKFNSDLADL